MTPTEWGEIGQGRRPSWYLDPLVATQKREENLALLRRWLSGSVPQRLLKTDLFEEAYGQDGLLAEFSGAATIVCGMDVALSTVSAASRKNGCANARFLTADVRSLPFCDESIDLIFSNSTLDHFESAGEFQQAVRELARVLRPNGRLIITLDNPWNPLYYMLRWAGRLGIGPFFLGYTTSQSGLARALADAGLEVLDTGLSIHNPRVVSTLLFLATRRLLGSHADGAVRLLLKLFSGLGRLPTRKLTACFITACGVKPTNVSPRSRS